MNSLPDIIINDINGEYAYGQYADFKVIIKKSNGYINVTKMCQSINELLGTNKIYRHWNETKSSDELCAAVSDAAGIPAALLTHVLTTSDPSISVIRGTYVHPDLIPHIASWASPKFAVKISKIVNRYFNDVELRKKEELLREKEDSITQLRRELDKRYYEFKKRDCEFKKELAEQNRISQEKIDALLSKNDSTNRQLGELKKQNDDIYEQNMDLNEKNGYGRR